MKVVYCKSTKQVAEKAYRILEVERATAVKRSKARKEAKKGAAKLRVFTPTGQSPRPLYEIIVKNKKIWQKVLEPIQIDEFVDAKKIFAEELAKYLLKPLGVKALGIN